MLTTLINFNPVAQVNLGAGIDGILFRRIPDNLSLTFPGSHWVASIDGLSFRVYRVDSFPPGADVYTLLGSGTWGGGASTFIRTDNFRTTVGFPGLIMFHDTSQLIGGQRVLRAAARCLGASNTSSPGIGVDTGEVVITTDPNLGAAEISNIGNATGFAMTRAGAELADIATYVL
jgi:hypothetical protein